MALRSAHNQSTMTDCPHCRKVQDRLSDVLPGKRRGVPGNVYCLDCDKPIPFVWNFGKPIPVRIVQCHALNPLLVADKTRT